MKSNRPGRTITRRRFTHVGQHAGTGVYEPRDRSGLKPELLGAVGRTVDLDFAGIAVAGERFSGQNLYQEHGGGGESILQSSWIPEQDVRFLDV